MTTKTVEQLTTELEETKKQLAALREACEAPRAPLPRHARLQFKSTGTVVRPTDTSGSR